MKKIVMLLILMMFLFIGNVYALPVGFGDTVKLTRSTSLQGHYVWDNVIKGNTFASFCLETNESMNYGGSYYVYNVSDSAFNGGAGGTLVDGGDPISNETRWLFTEFLLGNFAPTAFTINDFQDAFWYLEGEIGITTLNGNASALVGFAKEAINPSTGTLADYNFADIGVMNIRYGDVLKQSQLVGTTPVPEPATMVLLGSGLIGLALYRRKMKK